MNLRSLFPLYFLLLCVTLALSNPVKLLADDRASAVAAADDQRVAALVSGNLPALESLLSAELAYTHSNGKKDTRDSLLAGLRDGSMKYHSIQYETREFRPASPDIMLMIGRSRIEAGQPATSLHISFLGVWRLENGQWRFLAWQSCRLPPPP